MNGAFSTLPATPDVVPSGDLASGPMSMRLTLTVWAAASICGWALVLLALLPLL